MIDCKNFFESLQKNGIGFFTGVPDSLLKDFCAYVTNHTKGKEHVIAANEGGAVALATGYHLATGNIPLVYLQNSGLGNTVNPLLSLADKEVYGIPMILVIGWRGQPGIKDEPQHIKQGRIQNHMLEAMEVPYFTLDASEQNLSAFIAGVVKTAVQKKSPVAIIVKKGTFSPYPLSPSEQGQFEMSRESAIQLILQSIPAGAIVVSTTGKASREVYECRMALKQGHERDFLTVGSMGHASQIALGVSMQINKPVYCLDGDGAAIMHLGSLGISGKYASGNFTHILINNGSHDSVGGQPTIGFEIDFCKIADACGYKQVFSVSKASELGASLKEQRQNNGPVFIEVCVNNGSRKDLGRPRSSPEENKTNLMKHIRETKS